MKRSLMFYNCCDIKPIWKDIFTRQAIVISYLYTFPNDKCLKNLFEDACYVNLFLFAKPMRTIF